MKEYKFESIIKASSIGSGGAYVEFPFNVEKEFGIKGRVPVICRFDNVEYIGSLVKMGTSCHIIGVTKEIRNKISKDIGDKIKVKLSKDEVERVVDLHPLLKSEFGKEKILKINYEKLSFTRKKEINVLLTDAKKEETLKGRLNKIIQELKKK